MQCIVAQVNSKTTSYNKMARTRIEKVHSFQLDQANIDITSRDERQSKSVEMDEILSMNGRNRGVLETEIDSVIPETTTAKFFPENIEETKKGKDRNKITDKKTDNFDETVNNNSDQRSCKGLYNPSVFMRLLNICRDCFNLYKEPEVYTLCTDGCFNNKYLLHCAKALLVEEHKLEPLINQIGKK